MVKQTEIRKAIETGIKHYRLGRATGMYTRDLPADEAHHIKAALKAAGFSVVRVRQPKPAFEKGDDR